MKPACVIAEQNLPIAALLRGFAERYGFQVIPIAEGDRILEFVLHAQPVVIFIDVLLPGKTRGFTAIQDLKADPKTSRIPIIAIVEDFDGELYRLAKDAGACLRGTANYQDFLICLAQAGVQFEK